MEVRCPDCGVAMTQVGLDTGQGRFAVTTVHDDGLLDAVGLQKSHDVTPHLCEECGLVRLYADLD